MNLLLEIDLDSGTLYRAKSNQMLSGKQYIAGIISGGNISQVMAPDGGYQVSVSNIILEDRERYIRRKLISEAIEGKEIRIKDEKGNLKNTSVVESWKPGNDIIELRLSSRISVKKEFTKTVLEGPWNPAYINDSVKNQIIPMVFNTYTNIQAFLVDNRVNVGGIWLLGNRPISSVTRFHIGRDWETSYWTLQNDGTYWWVKMSHGVIMGPEYGNPQFAWVDVTTPTYNPVQIITSQLSGYLTVGTNTAFLNWLIARGFDSSTKYHYYLHEKMTPENALNRFCRNFNCGWRFDEQNEVIFEFLDRTSIVVEKTFSSGIEKAEIPGGIISQDFYESNTVRNLIRFSYDWNQLENAFNSYDELQGDDTGYGIHEYQINLEYIPAYAAGALDIANEIYENHKYPVGNIGLKTSYDIGKEIDPGAKIQVQNRALKNTNLIFGIVAKTVIDHIRNEMDIYIADKNFIYPYYLLVDEDTGIPICFDGEMLLIE